MTAECRCLECFLPIQICICNEIERLFSIHPFRPKADLLVYMHSKEWGRSSNTGKLMVKGIDNSALHLYGIREQEEELMMKLSSAPSLILFPSSNSTSIANFKDVYTKGDIKNICVIDGTWSQARTMDKKIPADIPRVKVDDFVLRASEFLNRKQTQADRVSTIEAVTIALQALGETLEDLLPMQQALRLSVDSVNRMRGKAEVYGYDFVQKTICHNDNTDLGAFYTKPTVKRPQSCPNCKASHSNTVFKNSGARKGINSIRPDFGVANAVHTVGTVSDGIAPASGDGSYRVWKCQACKQFFYVDN